MALDQVAQFSLFGGAPAEVQQQVAAWMVYRKFSSGQMVILAGESCPSLYLVERGVLRCYDISWDGRELVLFFFGPGDCFLLGPALDGQAAWLSVQAMTDVSLYALDRDRLRFLVQTCPAVAVSTLDLLAAQTRQMGHIIDGLAFHSVRTRLARFLLAQSDGRLPRYAWTQNDIAAHIGSVRDVVGRSLKEMVQDGLLKYERGRLMILDRQRLQDETRPKFGV